MMRTPIENPYAPPLAQGLPERGAARPELEALSPARLNRLARTSWIMIWATPCFLAAIPGVAWLITEATRGLRLGNEDVEAVAATILTIIAALAALFAAHAISLRPSDVRKRIAIASTLGLAIGAATIVSSVWLVYDVPWLATDGAWRIMTCGAAALILAAWSLQRRLRDADELFGDDRFTHEDLREELLRRADLTDRLAVADEA
ncbi:MAG: hypothetical protein QM811_23255 [Pirellulales bacterium]